MNFQKRPDKGKASAAHSNGLGSFENNPGPRLCKRRRRMKSDFDDCIMQKARFGPALPPPPAAAMEWRYIALAAFFLLGLWHRGGREEVQCYIFSVALIFLTVFTFIMEDF